jgi:hypothetical protein
MMMMMMMMMMVMVVVVVVSDCCHANQPTSQSLSSTGLGGGGVTAGR